MSIQNGHSGEIAVHRLQLPRDTQRSDVLTMLRNVLPQAETDADGAIALGDGARLVPDATPRGSGRWSIEVVREREDPAPPGSDDSHGYARAFPDGLPFGDERLVLDLAWSLARRLNGAVVTDSGVRLEPHPFHVRDLTVVSPYALAPESLAELIAPLEPEATLDEAPSEVARSGYSVTIPLEDGSEISLRVSRAGHHPALTALPWVDTAVDYDLAHFPLDEEEDEMERPDTDTSERWANAYRRVGLLAGLLVEAVGGYVIDLEGYLVDPADLV
ncbi:hypothetical protein ACXET9_10495 [Brachybacterium sp. DNPG3]